MKKQPDSQNVDLGTYDAFNDVTSWDDNTSQQWVDILNTRAASPDQNKLRKRLIQVANLREGDTAVEIGCGTGALLCDLAKAVGPNGRVIGIEPQPALAQSAIQNLSLAGFEAGSEVIIESADHLSIESGLVSACIAQTVLIHLPDNILQKALSEMIRAVRRGGKIISVDQDGDTWTIDHPNRNLTRRIVHFNSDQRYADGWTGRRLRRFFRQAGLTNVDVQVWTHIDLEADSYLFIMAIRIAKAAAEAGVISDSECDEWVQQLKEVASVNNFFSSINFYTCCGVRSLKKPLQANVYKK